MSRAIRLPMQFDPQWTRDGDPCAKRPEGRAVGAGGSGAVSVVSQELRFEEESTRLLRTARAVVRCRQDAEDAVQEAWIEWLRQEPGAVRFPRAWLRLSVLHAAHRIRRRDTRRREHEAACAREEALPSALEAFVSRRETQRMLRRFATVPEPYRSVLKLTFCAGLTSPEIARRLGRNPATVRSHLSRGLKKLREVLPAEACPNA